MKDNDGNVSERGGEYVAEGGMNKWNRREPRPPHDIGNGQIRGDTPGLGDREEITDRFGAFTLAQHFPLALTQ